MGVRAVETITASVIVYLWSARAVRFAALEGRLALLRVSHQMVGGVTELNVDGAYALEVMPDVQLVAHPHAPVKLHGLLCDKACGVSDLRLRAGRQFRSIWFLGGEAEIQMLGERNRLFERYEHVDHAVLQHLKGAESDPELLARFTILQRRGIQHGHGTDRFGAEGCDCPVAARFERCYGFSFGPKQLAGRHFHIHQRQFGSAPTIEGLEALQV